MREGLLVNPTKTSVVPFTKKRKLLGMRGLHFFGTPLKLEAEVKYLSVILDGILTFKPHQERITSNKATRTLWAFRRTFGKNWGFSLRMIIWIYTMIVIPVTLYAGIVWWP